MDWSDTERYNDGHNSDKIQSRAYHHRRRQKFYDGKNHALQRKVIQQRRGLVYSMMQSLEDIRLRMWASSRLLTSRGRWQICKSRIMFRIAGIVNIIGEFLWQGR